MEPKRRGGQGRRPAANDTPDTSTTPSSPAPEVTPPGTTGKYLVLMREDAVASGVRALSDVAGLRVARTADFSGGVADAETLASAEALLFDQLGVVVVDAPPEQIRALGATAADSGILAIEPERVVYALEEGWPAMLTPPRLNPPASSGVPVEYLQGYRDAVNHLVDRLLAAAGMPEGAVGEALAAPPRETELTWGLQVTNVAASRYSGRGIRVAVLDTGLDLLHPDFAGRQVTAKSFVPNQEAQDGHGHGTHCIGTACGPLRPGQLPRYGIAHGAEIYAGKVLSNRGSGSDSGILAGIGWAISNGCHLISMSLGAAVFPGQGYSTVFEQVAQRALAAGTLIVAAAGNESERPRVIQPVGHPANCPSVIAVGALDAQLRVAAFSNGGLNPQGGQVDIAAPGVQIRSTWPRPTLYHTISGTSMATPHVAGIAALLAEAQPAARGRALANLLTQTARRLVLPARDVGSGLVQAP